MLYFYTCLHYFNNRCKIWHIMMPSPSFHSALHKGYLAGRLASGANKYKIIILIRIDRKTIQENIIYLNSGQIENKAVMIMLLLKMLPWDMWQLLTSYLWTLPISFQPNLKIENFPNKKELQGFWTLSIIWHSRNKKTQHFGNCIFFRPQVREGEKTPIQLGPLVRG